jgi:hypothetical protein
LQVDPKVYRDTVTWYGRAQLERRAALLSHIKEMEILKDNRDSLLRLAENMEQIKLEPGVLIDRQYFGNQDQDNGLFVVVEEGLLVKHRKVDFGKETSVVETELGLTLRIPRGFRNVKVGKYGPKTMFPDPAFATCCPYPFTIVVVEPVSGYILKYRDLVSLLLSAQLQQLVTDFAKEPGDAQVIEEWIQRQSLVQWESFKRKCVKEVRRQVRVERAVMSGEWGFRKTGRPKAIKDFRPQTGIERSRPLDD